VDDRPLTWDYIYGAIVVPNCTTSGCHSALTQTQNLNFSDKAFAKAIFSDPTSTNLNERLMGTAGTQVYRMPPDQPLPNKDIDLIIRWQNAGAP